MFALKIAFAQALYRLAILLQHAQAAVTVALDETAHAGFRARSRAEAGARAARQQATTDALAAYNRLADQEQADLHAIATRAWKL